MKAGPRRRALGNNGVGIVRNGLGLDGMPEARGRAGLDLPAARVLERPQPGRHCRAGLLHAPRGIPWRCARRGRVAERIAEEIRGIHYGNFKLTVGPQGRHSAYYDVWQTMARYQREKLD